MNTRETILKLISNKGGMSGSEIARSIDISRQAVNKHLRELIKAGMIRKIGSTRNAKYLIEDKSSPNISNVKKIFKLNSIAEDKVFNEIALVLNLEKKLSYNSFEIFNYAFTEILNNAIDHSKSEKCEVIVEWDNFNISFIIRDFGIGIFYSIASKFNLKDEIYSVIELIKGKRTTFREKHSGEGVFFTSKLGDIVRIRSHKFVLTFNNLKNDIFFGNKKYIEGTEVYFNIKRHSKRKIIDIMNSYAPEEFDFKFQRTKISVKLLQNEYVSRSEAKRLLAGLDKFKEIILDFKGVKNIGQGFTDEIFRVFKNKHPIIKISIINTSPEIERIIRHVS
ncbi:MAG: DUF4325 domain-containing protein [Proteobacteria bacterium]|nr:DUF4325 domain-containing protein [Pseudomonadota bacterium]